jgi:hypothetical protein
MDDTQELQQERIDFLLKEYDDHRDAIKDMIKDLEKIRVRVDTLIPDTLDARYMRFFEEKVKSITGLFNSLLEMRKEIAKSVKDEIEIRRRIKGDDDLIDIEDMLDVRSMANKIDKFKEETIKSQKNRLKLIKDQKIDSEIEVPGLTDEKGRSVKNDG